MNQRIPKNIHKERLKMHNTNIQHRLQYFDPQTNAFYEELLEKRLCPTCNQADEQFLFIKDGGSYVKCKNCEMIYLNPVFKDEHLEKHYRKNTAMQGEIVANDSKFYTFIYTKGLDAIQKIVQNGSIFDIGCSAGGFLDIAKSKGWKTYGVELNEKEAAFTQTKGHIVYNDLLSNLKIEKMNVITLWDVFEHLKDGKAYLKQMKEMLSQDGVIFLQIPSADALAAKILQEKCNMFDGIEHVNIYSFKSIKKLAQDCGFEIVHHETVISEIGVINNYLNYDNPYFGDTTNTKTLLGFDEEWLHNQKLGYKMQLVLKEKK